MIKARTLSHLAAVASFAVPYLGSAQGALAVAENWQVGRISGHAWIDKMDGERSDLALGMEVEPGVTIYTARVANVTLLRGPESMVIGPASIIAVSEHPTEGLSTTVLEKTGSVQFDVQRENVRHFSVETPMLAAVVKGTHFTVKVSRRSGGVAVSRGTVEVTSLATGQIANVTAGQRASVGTRGLAVDGRGQLPSITQGPPRAAIVAPTGFVSALSQVNAFSPAELAAVATVTDTTISAVAAPAAATAAPQATGQSANASQRNATATPVATVAKVTAPASAPGLLAAVTSALASATAKTSTVSSAPTSVSLSVSKVSPGNVPGVAFNGFGHGSARDRGLIGHEIGAIAHALGLGGNHHGNEPGPGTSPASSPAGSKSDHGVGNNNTPGNGHGASRSPGGFGSRGGHIH